MTPEVPPKYEEPASDKSASNTLILPKNTCAIPLLSNRTVPAPSAVYNVSMTASHPSQVQSQ